MSGRPRHLRAVFVVYQSASDDEACGTTHATKDRIKTSTPRTPSVLLSWKILPHLRLRMAENRVRSGHVPAHASLVGLSTPSCRVLVRLRRTRSDGGSRPSADGGRSSVSRVESAISPPACDRIRRVGRISRHVVYTLREYRSRGRLGAHIQS